MRKKPRPEMRKTFPPSSGGWKNWLKRKAYCPRRRSERRLMLLHLLATDSDWTLTMARIILGVVFFAHGCQKLLGLFGGPGLKATVRVMHESLGVPIPLAFLAVAAELFGGLGLMVGLLSRVAAFGIAVVMLV